MNRSQHRPGTARVLLVRWTTGVILLAGGLSTTASAESATPAAAGTPTQEVTFVKAKVLPEPTPAELAAGQALLARAVKATFRGEPSDLKTFFWSDSGGLHVGPQTFPIWTKTTLVPKRCYHSEQLLPMGVVTVAFCDSSGWARTFRGGIRPLGEAEWKQQRRDREMDLVRVLLEASKLKARPLPDTVLLAGPAAGVSVASDLVNDWRLWMNKESGRIVRCDFLDPPPSGEGIARHAWEFYDYQPATALLMWPTLRKKTINGEPMLELALLKAESNVPAPDSLFTSPW